MQPTYSPAGQHPEQMDGLTTSLPRHVYKPLNSTQSSQAQQSRPKSRERSAYRLFPPGPVHQRLPPGTPQKETRHKRRSVSLDDTVRKNGETQSLSSQRSNSSLRRKKGSVPDVKTPMTTVQERPQDPSAFLPESSYKPWVSEEGGHGRSSSAPDDFVRDIPQEPHCHSRQPSSECSISRSDTTHRGLGLTVQRKQSVKQQHRNLRLKIEKPLPPRPGSIIELSRQPNGSSSGNLSRPSQSAPQSAARQDSVTQITSFHKTSVSASDNSYVPFSSDAKMRELMGLPPSVLELARGRKPAPIETKRLVMGSPSLTLSPPSSKFQKAFSPTDTSCNTDTIDHAIHAQQSRSQPSQEDRPQAPTPTSPVRTEVPQASGASTPDMAMMPAGLRVAPTKRRASTSRAPPPAMLEPRKWASASGPATASSADGQVLSASATLSELAKQTETLYARYTGLRSERQKLSSAIVNDLKENRPGPDYANSLLDQHMSLAAISSSMDICVAKLKSLEYRKEEAIATIAASSKKPYCKASKTDFDRSTESESSTLSTDFSAATISNHHASPMPMSEILNMYSLPRANPTTSTIESGSPSASQLGSAVHQFTNEPPRRMNVKGAKAAKILGLVQEAENEQRPASPSITLPPPSATRSTRPLTPIEADSKPPNPAPVRPLPAPPALRGRMPSPSPESVRSQSRAAARKENGHDAYWNSRGSSPSSSPEEREAYTPQEEVLGHVPRFGEVRKCNTDSMQTVHVYLSEPMLSSTELSCVGEDRMSYLGEDDLLEYYRDLR